MDDVRQSSLQHHRPRLDVDGARVEARQVEQLLQQPTQALALLDPDVEQLLAELVRQAGAAFLQRLEHPIDRGGRRPQLVRGDRDEVELQLVELDQLLVQLRPLDRDRDPLGDELQQLHLVPRELPRAERPDMEDAERAHRARAAARRPST